MYLVAGYTPEALVSKGLPMSSSVCQGEARALEMVAHMIASGASLIKVRLAPWPEDRPDSPASAAGVLGGDAAADDPCRGVGCCGASPGWLTYEPSGLLRPLRASRLSAARRRIFPPAV